MIFFLDMTYQNTVFWTLDIFINRKIVFLARYKGVDIRVADLSCRDESENLIKEFRGAFLTLFLDKNMKGHTIVKPRKFSLISFFCYLPELLFIFLTIIRIITVKNKEQVRYEKFSAIQSII